MPVTNEVLLKRAKAMRSLPTLAKARLWYNLRAKRFERVKFSHQVVIDPYIVDFIARSRKFIIELDGDTPTTNDTTCGGPPGLSSKVIA